jgi:predicted NAD/FAD-dependent oxidoreductase
MKYVFPVSENLIKQLADDLKIVESTKVEEIEISIDKSSSVEK